MKRLIFFLFFLPMITSAQEFSFELYFEDALGNRDTLVLGYDPLATDSIDATFGEENIISQPWDSVFDARIGNKTYSQNTWLSNNTYLTKKQILTSYCDGSLVSSRVSLQFYSTNYPIKLKWNKTLFENDTCRHFSVFFGKIDYLNTDAINGTYLQFEDSLYIKPYTNVSGQNIMSTHFINTVNQELTPYYSLTTYTDGTKEIGVLQFVFYSLEVAEMDQLEWDNLKVSPNPVNSNENIKINAQGNYTIVDIQGKAIQKGTIENNSVQLINVESGIYFFILENENAVYKTKFVVR